MRFGARLKRYRIAAGLSQEGLAERAGLSARAISDLERGQRHAPYRDTVGLLARALSLTPDETAALDAAVSRQRGPKKSPAPGRAASGRTNLPAPLTSFVGRQREIAEVTHLLGHTRLLTLTGTGGCGKTRLALQVAGELAGAYPDGIWLVDLAPLSDPSLVPRAVAAATGVRDEPNLPLPETLLAALHARGLLLILDNCEHLLDACAELAAALLQACPRLRILATSRQPLGIAGEVNWRVPSLPFPGGSPLRSGPEGSESDLGALSRKRSDPALGNQNVGGNGGLPLRLSNPDPGGNPSPLSAAATLREYAAVRLFVERARGARPGFAANSLNAPAVAEICRRLDGIPLAIELAAARVKVLSVAQIAQRLDDRFRFLTGGGREVLPRHQTLRATLDWSYALLDEPERALFRRLAVFVGSFNLDAVEAVGDEGARPWGWSQLHATQHPVPDSPSVIDRLTELVDKSLVQVEEEDGEARYRLLETLRQYGREKLAEAGEAQDARRRHRDWYRALAERAEPELGGPRQRAWLDRLEREHDNLRAVIEGSGDNAADLEDGLRAAAALLRFWIVRGYLGEGRHLVAALMASTAATSAVRHTRAWMKALHCSGFAAYFQGDYVEMGRIAAEWLVLARELGDEAAIWLADDMQARAAMNQGDYPRARLVFEGELAAMRRLGDRFGICSGLVGLGVLARLQGHDEEAVGFCEECLAESRRTGDLWFIGQALSNLGLAYFHQGQYGVARKHFAEALAVRRDLRDQSGIAWSLTNLGDVEQAQGDYAAARDRFEESLAILRDLGDRSGRADALASLGRVGRAQRDFASARACFVESLLLRRDLGHRLATPAILEDLAGLAAAEGDDARVLVLTSAATALRATLGAPRSAADEQQIEGWLGPARAALGDEAAADAWNEGQAMTLEQTIAFAAGEGDA